MKKVLLYANYFYPELASLSQLYTDLCLGMKDDLEITVICSVPCYTGDIEEKYLKQRFYFENYEGIKIIRVRVPKVDKSSKMSRVKHIVTYFFNSMSATFKAEKPDVVFTCSQPPVLGGLLGVFGKVFRRAKMIYNIQDFNPEQIIAVDYSSTGFVVKLLMMLDKLSCKAADNVIVVGSDMKDTLINRFKNSSKTPKCSVISNWIDEKSVYPLPSDNEKIISYKKKYGIEDKFIIMYSGNVGLFYDFSNIIKVIEKFKDNDDIVFTIQGDGTEKASLQEYCEKHEMKNVVFIPYQDKEELIYSLNAADVYWCINAKGIKGVSCPSKLYGIMGVGKPVLAVLEKGTQARNLIEETNCGFACEPGDYKSIEELIIKFIALKNSDELCIMGKSGREYLEKNLTKEISIDKYKQEILKL